MGGKDSTAMLLRMLEENMPIDKIIFVDTGKDFPDMIEHIREVQNYIVKNYGKEITTLMPRKSFDYYMFEHEKTKGKNKGKKGYGWATMLCRWCTSNLKTRTINNYLKQFEKEGYIEYIGIAYDEPNLSAYECCKKSIEKMKGNRGNYFVLTLSFIGWALLSILTLGIGFFWLIPYINVSYVCFYEEVVGKKEEKEVVEVEG